MEKHQKLKADNEKYRPKKLNRYELLASTLSQEKQTVDRPKMLIPGILDDLTQIIIKLKF